MQPRGQLWFELQRICQDFRTYSGLSEREALGVLVAVLRNLLAESEAELWNLDTPRAAPENKPEDRPSPT
jgi:hypothetical protein